MADKSDWVVDGFQFGTQSDAEQAKNELLRIEQLEKKLDYNNSVMIEAVYKKAIENRIFKTPVGYVFMKKLQRSLVKKSSAIEDIGNIPVLSVSGFRDNVTETKERIKASTKPVKPKRTKKELSIKALLGVNAILVVLIGVLFYITINGSTNPNILNYEKALQNKYSEWDKSLNERETALRAKERELLMEK